MQKVPRASLTINLLGDEDFRVLVGMRGGAEAFGVFVAMLVVGRERLQRSQARQLYDTEALRFDNSTMHVSTMAYIKHTQLLSAVSVVGEVAKVTGHEPWMYLDESGHLVIRSFFKFNASKDWGGKRAGSGRPTKEESSGNQDNQDDSENNHLDSSLSLSLSPSVSLSPGEADEQPTITKPIDPGNPPITVVPSGKDSPDAIALEKWAGEFGVSPEGDGYGHWARMTCDFVPADWIRAAMQAEVVGLSGLNRKGVRYIGGMLKNWLKAGRCPLIVVPGDPRASPAESRPRPSRNAPASPERKAELIEILRKARNGGD
jgi:hypothetical protein